jgi:hypothetical protein
MKVTGIWLCVAALLFSAQRLPAPISEIPKATPAPKPKREATSRSKPKPEAAPKPTPSLSFAGAWTGSAVSTDNDGSNATHVYLIKVSDDEKTVWVEWSPIGEPLSGNSHQAQCNRYRGTLTWSLTLPEWTATCALQINTNGTASYAVSGANQGNNFTSTGTLSRQDVSSVPSIPQTTTVAAPPKTITTAVPQTTGIPTATPVPNKPGFVYNPFDPTRKRILDVRGIASGTKVTIPATGKQFIVP